jgi:hypothetical protein
MMLADEGFVIAQFVEPLDQLHVSLERQSGVLADTMKRGHEDSEFHFFSPTFSAVYALWGNVKEFAMPEGH